MDRSHRVSHLEAKLGCARGVISGVHWAGHGFPGHPIVLGVYVCSDGGRLAHQSCCCDLYSGNECPIFPFSGTAHGAEFCVPLDIVGGGGTGCQNGPAPATHSSHIVHEAPCLHMIRREKGKTGSQSQIIGPGWGLGTGQLAVRLESF